MSNVNNITLKSWSTLSIKISIVDTYDKVMFTQIQSNIHVIISTYTHNNA